MNFEASPYTYYILVHLISKNFIKYTNNQHLLNASYLSNHLVLSKLIYERKLPLPQSNQQLEWFARSCCEFNECYRIWKNNFDYYWRNQKVSENPNIIPKPNSTPLLTLTHKIFKRKLKRNKIYFNIIKNY